MFFDRSFTSHTRGGLAALTFCTLLPLGCSPAPLQSLIQITDEPAGDNCPAGGERVDTGIDADGDGMLSDTEISATAYVCNGSDGMAGATGMDGTPGTNGATGPIGDQGDPGRQGEQGDAGANGLASLIRTSAEPAGANCTNGGVKISVGVDTNGDGMLEDSEVTNTAYVCNGTNGTSGTNSLLRISAEPAGANCADGGKKIETGLDANGDGVLEDSEVNAAETTYLCNP